MIKRFTAVAVAVGALGASGVAEAAVKAGLYTGETSQKADVSLRVISSKKAVINYSFEGAVLGCENGATIQLEGFKTPRANKFTIKKGKFGFTATGDAQQVQVRGLIKSPRATGTLRFLAIVNDQGQLDPNGQIGCDSGKLPWAAKRR